MRKATLNLIQPNYISTTQTTEQLCDALIAVLNHEYHQALQCVVLSRYHKKVPIFKTEHKYILEKAQQKLKDLYIETIIEEE